MFIKFIVFFSLLFSIATGCKKKDSDNNPLPPPANSPIRLDSSSFVLGNLEKQILDTFILQFNKPVIVDYILLLSSTCLPTIKHSSFNNGRTIKFYELLCGRLGNDYSFEVNVHDEKGKILKDTVSFSYYHHKFQTEGQIMHYMIMPDNQNLWICTNAPNRIYNFNLTDTSYRKVYNVNFMPFKRTANPYNHKFYILNNPFYNTDLDKIFVMNPPDGNIEKIIVINKDANDDPQKHINVYDINFGFNGYGIINTGTREYGSSRWRVLDSRYNDTVYPHPQWLASLGGGNQPYSEIVSILPNYNRTKIYLRLPYATPRAGVMDVNSGIVSLLVYPNTNPNHYLVTSKTTDRVFIGSFSYQAIIGTGSTNNYSQFDNRYSETADFSYRPGEENFIYYRGRDYNYNLNILDYNQAKILMTTNVGPNFTSIQATTDGKYLLAIVDNQLTLFHTNQFYTYL